MAHKIRVPLYRRLRDLLEATGQSYSVYVSTALHENTSFDGSFVVRFEELQSIFNGQVYFMGYLSDTAVFNHLMDCTFLAAFFEKGLRANNTTVNAAMECGCAVITNLDEHSPAGLVHMQNVIDINLCERLPDADADAAHRPRRTRDRARPVRMGPARRAAAARRSMARATGGAARYRQIVAAQPPSGDDVAGTLKIGTHEIGDHTQCYVIAEIGHNHQGSLDKARELFREAKLAGAHAVKLQKRDNRGLYTRAAYDKPYDNENSFGADLRRAPRVPRVRRATSTRSCRPTPRSSASTSSPPRSTSRAPTSSRRSTCRPTRSRRAT